MKCKTFLMFSVIFVILCFFMVSFVIMIYQDYLNKEAAKVDNYALFLAHIVNHHSPSDFDKYIFLQNEYEWEIIITDNKGRLLYTSENDYDKMTTEEKDYKNYPSVINALLGNWGLQRITINNRAYFTSSRIVSDTGIIIVVDVPEKIIAGSALRLIIPVIIFVLIIIFSFVSLYIILKNMILKPIEILTVNINRFSENKTVEPILYNKKNEIGFALESFENLILERKRLEREILEISENERKRIGRDLHDDLGQILTGISFQLLLLNEELEETEGGKQEILESLSDLIKEAISKTKMIAKGLCPVNLFVDDGLFSSIEELSKNIIKLYNKECFFSYDNSIIINDMAFSSNLYYIIIEAVNNALKHSDCRKIEIRLSKEGDRIRLIIKDDGKGFDNKKISGMGLKNLKYRVDLFGGNLDIETVLNEGTTISCLLKTE